MKDNRGRFMKGNKPIVHEDTLLKRGNSIKKIWKEHPEIYKNNNKSIKTQITQEIIDKIISMYKKWNDGTRVARELHIGDKKIYEILEACNLGHKWGKNLKSRNGFQKGHRVPKEWKKKWSKNRPTTFGKNNPFYGKKHSEKTKKKLREAMSKRIFPKKDTKIEVKIQNFLKQLGIEFFTHQYMKEIEHSYQCDILIPSMNLVIECDGDYWHKYPVGNDLDHIRTSELIKKGFRVLRLWEFEINKMGIEEFKNRLKERK